VILLVTGSLLATEVNPARAEAPDLRAERALAAVRAGRADALAWLWTHSSNPEVLQAALRTGTPLVRAHATWLGADRAASRGELDAANELRRGVGWIEHAWLAPARLGRADPAALRAVPAASWRPLTASPARGAFRPAGALGGRERRAAWLLLLVEVERAVETRLRLGTSGRATLVLPSAAPVELPELERAGLDQHGLRIPLPGGRTAVALHLADEERVGNVIVRWSGLDERRLPRLRTIRDRRALGAALDTAAGASRPSLLPPLVNRSRSVSSATDLALRAELTEALSLDRRSDDPRSVQRDLEAALAEAPAWAEGWSWLGRRLATEDGDRARDAFERALELDPDLASAWVGLGDLARRAERPLAAAHAYDRAIRSEPTAWTAWARRSELGFDLLGETALALRRLETSPVATEPEVCAQLARIQLSLGDAARAEAWARRGLAADATHGLLRSLSFDAAVRRGDVEAAVRIAEMGRRLAPDRPRWYLELVRLHAGRAPTRSAEVLSTARARFPSIADVHIAAAELARITGRDRDVPGHLAEALRWAPRRHALADWLADLRGPTTRQAPPTEDTLGRLAELPPTPAEAHHGAVVLRETRDLRLAPDGTWSREVHRFVRVSEPAQHPELQRSLIEFAPSREAVQISVARRMSTDGQIAPAEGTSETRVSPRIDGMYVDQSTRVVEFGPLQPNDLIELRYRVESLGPNPFGDFFGSIELVRGSLPIRELVVRARSPTDTPLFTRQPGLPPPRSTEVGEGRMLEWTFEHLAPLPAEPLGPARAAVSGLISISTYGDWARLAAWYADLYRPQLQLDATSRSAGRAATRGLETTAEIVRASFAHVVDGTRYVGIELGIHGWKPYAAHEVFRRGYGDCKDMSTLLIALLADRGIDASLVLVRTVDRGPFPDDAVNLWAFNHAIVYVPALDRFLDPTFRRGGGRLPPAVEGGLGLVVAPGGAHRLVQLPESGPEAHANAAQYDAFLSTDGELRLIGTERYVGAPAAEVRRRFEAAGARERELELHMGRHFPGFSVESLGFRGLEPDAESVEYDYEARVGRYGLRQHDRLILSLSLFQHDLTGNYATTAARETAIRLLHPWRASNRVRYHFPDTARLERLPEARHIESPWVSLEQRVERTDDGFVVRDVVTFRARRVDPGDYEAFRDACLAIDRAMQRNVVVEWQ
jgi:transglutaminase-like putative cysteine protease/tetratricopeptide (TPR) repeat protein